MATPATDTGEAISSTTINPDEIRLDTAEEGTDTSFQQQLEEFSGEGGGGEPESQAPAAPEPEPEPAKVPPGKPGDLPEKPIKAELDEPDPSQKAAPAEKPAVEQIKPHTEFADARSLRPAYEALRVRCETAEKVVVEKEARIAELAKRIEEAKTVKEEAEQLRAKVSNRDFQDTEAYQQAISPLRTEAQSIIARATELTMVGGRNDPDKISETIRRMVSLPDRGQRRQLANEIFEPEDVPEAVALASQLADVDRRYKATHSTWSEKASEFLKTSRVREISSLRESVEVIDKEMTARFGFIAKDEALKDSEENGARIASALLELDDLPARQRTAVLQEAFYRVRHFDAMWTAAYQALEQLKIANAALKRRGINPVPGGGGGGSVSKNGGGKKGEERTLNDELDEEFAKQQ
jgi:hypothetical protein